MKIGILTLPLGSNVGGTLQAFALNRVLRDLGYEVETISNHINRLDARFIVRIYMHFTEFFQRRFVKRKIKTSSISIINRDDFKRIFNYYDTLIVGSDQVWRIGCTNNNFNNYLLDIPKSDRCKLKIAYSCSFGISPNEIEKEWDTSNYHFFSKLIKDFDYISVREKSGIEFCNRFTNREVKHLLDPTMLLDSNDYLKLINCNYKSVFKDGRKKMFYYILDNSIQKENIKKVIAKKYDYEIREITTRKRIKDLLRLKSLNISNYMFPSIETWLGNIATADLVVTDSFHGMVFSVIFNKEFIVIDNSDRGSERFLSFLQVFGLEDRLLKSIDDYEFSSFKSIDYKRVNKILLNKRSESIEFLRKALSS